MNICEFIDIGLDQYQCHKCGLLISSEDGPPTFPCSALSQTDIDELAQTGLICTEKDIESRYKICSQCEHFSNLSCKQCGCIVTRGMNFKNKLLWKEHECPIGKWGKAS